MSELWQLGAAELARGILRGEVSSSEVVEARSALWVLALQFASCF